ncbi:hypothetical protein APHAL10511_002784 [Amanita phalloides]|nr:hypothetical protein APHAL10511_002784 [Amanita phalloides]
MVFTEFWLTYHFTSRAHLPPTTQLIELENLEHKLIDLEDVLDHVFRQGFVDPKYRPATWWERKDGVVVKASSTIEALLLEGIGKCPENALRLVIEDLPTTLWFSYIYIHKPHAQIVTQRIKFAGLQKRFEKIANVTNYVFAQGYLPHKYRSVVYWEAPCGKRISEAAIVDEILIAGDGISEGNPLRLVIDDKFPESCEPIHPHYPEHHHHEHYPEHHHHEHHHEHHRPYHHRPYTSCPASPTVVASPLKTVTYFH